MYRGMIILGIVGVLIWGGYRTVAGINFGRHCSGYLKNAADANTVKQAEERLAIAVKYIDDNELNHGFTSVLWTAPSEDVSFWAENLQSSLDELRNVSPEATSLEKSNVLMKLRETILDDGEKGTKVTRPMGISVFPRNSLWAWFGTLSFVLGICGVVGYKMNEDNYYGSRSRVSLVEVLVVCAIVALLVSILVGIG